MTPTKVQVNDRRVFYVIDLILLLYLISDYFVSIQRFYLRTIVIVGLLVINAYLLLTWKYFWK